ncbi:hypothetical protein GY45DRAFT_1357458 [Cubamyces sp. BRFM 1775]|nr:hypothetical protein GY45DRAFT_1357458 [Cubamyces sp. BRFM 1775]
MDKDYAVSWRVAFYSLLCFTILNATFISRTLSAVEHALLPTKAVYSYIGDDFPTELPIELPRVGLAFTSGEPYFSTYADDEWGAIFPPNDGFLPIGPPHLNRTFLLSFVHQLHCLDVLRVGYALPNDAPSSNLESSPHGNEQGSPGGRKAEFAHHVQHCLRYLRQTILCHADTTLEESRVGWKDGKWGYLASGYGSVHRCKDWTALRRYLGEHPPAPLSGE